MKKQQTLTKKLLIMTSPLKKMNRERKLSSALMALSPTLVRTSPTSSGNSDYWVKISIIRFSITAKRKNPSGLPRRRVASSPFQNLVKLMPFTTSSILDNPISRNFSNKHSRLWVIPHRQKALYIFPMKWLPSRIKPLKNLDTQLQLTPIAHSLKCLAVKDWA